MATQPPPALEDIQPSEHLPEELNGGERTAEEWAKLAASWSLKGYHESIRTRIETRKALVGMTVTVRRWVIGGVVTSVFLGRLVSFVLRHYHWLQS